VAKGATAIRRTEAVAALAGAYPALLYGGGHLLKVETLI